MFRPGQRLLLLSIVGLATIAGCGKKVDPQAELLAELTHNDLEVRRTAVVYLREMRPVPEVYIPALIQALNDNDPQIRQTAADALGEAGIGARPVINDLAKLSHEHFDPQVRYSLQRAVQKISAAQ
jgi:HEAT repeat protein